MVIADQIVTKFNGKINLTSVPEEGSTFTFTFKLENQQEQTDNLPVKHAEYELNST